MQTNIAPPKQTGMCQMFSTGIKPWEYCLFISSRYIYVSWLFVICIAICNLFVISISLDKEKF